MAEEKIPSIFRLNGEETTLLLSEFTASIQAKMAKEPKQRETIRADFRMGKLGHLIEADLRAIFTQNQAA